MFSCIDQVSSTLSVRTSADRDLTFAIGLPPIHTWSKAYTYVDDNIDARSGGAIAVEVHYGSLLNLKQSLNGLRDGIADAAVLVPGYHPAEMPQTKTNMHALNRTTVL